MCQTQWYMFATPLSIPSSWLHRKTTLPISLVLGQGHMTRTGQWSVNRSDISHWVLHSATHWNHLGKFKTYWYMNLNLLKFWFNWDWAQPEYLKTIWSFPDDSKVQQSLRAEVSHSQFWSLKPFCFIIPFFGDLRDKSTQILEAVSLRIWAMCRDRYWTWNLNKKYIFIILKLIYYHSIAFWLMQWKII